MKGKRDKLLKYLERVAGPGVRDAGDAAHAVASAALSGGTQVEGLALEFMRPDEAAGERTLVADALEANTPEAMAALEAVVLPEFRPAAGVLGGTYNPMSAPWTHFNEPRYKTVLEKVFSSVGPVEAPGVGVPYLGTAFLVGEGLLLTNRHVARYFTDGLGTTLRLRTELGPAIDFLREDGRNGPEGSAPFEIKAVRFIHPFWDAALLEVRGQLAGRTPLTLMATGPENFERADVAIVGYPAFSEVLPRDIAKNTFGGRYDVKRLQPGQIMDMREASSAGWPVVEAIAHDASTLAGNSGSVVVYLPRLKDGSPGEGFGQVIGLHFAGAYLEANYAVPVWELGQDIFVEKAGKLRFTERVVPAESPWKAYWDRTVPSGVATPGAESSLTPLSAPSVAPSTHSADGEFCACEESEREGDVSTETVAEAATVTGAPQPPSATLELSGAHWVGRYPGSRSIQALRAPFRDCVQRFTDALSAAGVDVRISATYRPPERAYLMHWCCRIAKKEVGPASVPAMAGVPIQWDHGDLAASRRAAAEMMQAFNIAFPAALRSRHTQGRAIDMTLTWGSTVSIRDGTGALTVVAPGTGSKSTEMFAVGRSFGVYKLVSDAPHWSEDGH